MSDELRTLVDRSEIVGLVDRLGRWLDERRWNEAPSLFTADATAETPGGVARGRDALVAQARRNHDGHPTQHVISNHIVELDGDRATVDANLIVTFAVPGAPSQLGERYRFEARRTDAGWRLASVHVRPLWRSGVTQAPA